MPNLQLEIPALNSADFTPAQKRQIANAFLSFSEQLKYVLSNLETENFSLPTRKRMADVEAAAEAASQLAGELDQGVTNAAKKLYDEIVAKATEITQNYTVALGATADSITGSVAENYTAKSETASLAQQLSSYMEQTSRDISFSFNEATGYSVEVNGRLQEFIDEIRTYIRFSAEGIELGELHSPFLAKLSNTRLSFLQSGVEIAYISNNKMYITDAEVTNKLTIGNSSTGRFDWKTEVNGSLSLTKQT